MTLTATPHTVTAVRVSGDLTWTPGHLWGAGTTHVDGQLSDGRVIAVATHGDHDLARPGLRIDATHEWLHYGLLVVDEDGLPTLVVPVDRLNEGIIAEALRRWLLVQRRPQQAVAG